MFDITVHAQGATPPPLTALEGVFGNFLFAALPIFAIVLLVMFILGGIAITSSGTNAAKLEQGKKTLTYAIAGLFLAALSYLILVLISRYTGNTRILNFSILLP